jgi:DNA-binding IclR family transcriptional regulator
LSEPKKTQQGINSVLIGVSILDVIVDAGGAISLNAISAKVDMSPAKAHRYLVSLIETGLVERLKEPGLYDLGPKALKLGLKAIQRIDRVSIANEEVVSLNSRIDETVFLSIWNDDEALVVGRKASSRPITLMVRIGEVLSPFYNATGRLFAAYLNDAELDNLLKSFSSLPRQPQLNGQDLDRSEFVEELRAIRTVKFSIGIGDFQSSVCSYSVPIMNARGGIEFALTVIGYENDIGDPNNKAAMRVKSELQISMERLKEKLGAWEAI